MKKILTLLIALLLIPNLSFAVISAGWNATSTTSGVIAPTRINGTEQIVQSDSYRATSTNATSTFSGGLSVLGNSSLSTTTNTTSSANTGIVAWGDSLTEGQGLGRFSYPSELQKLLGRPVYNRGASGETSTQIKNRFLEATNDFDMPVIFWVGTNDRFTSNASTTVIANLNLMIAQLASSTRYIILGPVSNSTETAGSAYNNTVIDINTWLSTTYGTHYLDVWQMLKDNNNGSGQDLTDVANNVTPSSLRDDATHLNQRGYALVASYIRSNASWLQLGTPDGSVINQYALNNTLDSPNFLGLINQPSGFFRNLSVNASTTNTSDFRDWQFLNITNTAQPKLSGTQETPKYNTYSPYAEGTISTDEVPSGEFTATTGWTGTRATGYTHTVGNTSALGIAVPDITGTSGSHIVSFDMAGRAGGSMQVTLGGVNGYVNDNFVAPSTITVNRHYELGMNATSTSELLFTPSSTFDGTITNIKVNRINRDTASVFTIFDAMSSPAFEMRVGSSTSVNMALGVNAGRSLAPITSNGSASNILIGANAGKNLVAGVGNVIVARNGLQASYSTHGNTGIGASVFFSLLSGVYNTVAGYLGMYNTTTGSYDTCNGWACLYTNTTGSRITSSGYASGFSNLSGSDIVNIGYHAGYTNSTGSNILNLGTYAGKYNTASNAFYVDSYDRSTTAGDKAGALLYGLFNSTPSSQTLTINASTSIAQNLNVHGTGNNYLFGNTGIGTTSPESLLDVDGLGTFGVPSATTAQLVVKGGKFGGDLIQLQRTDGATLTYGWSLGGGALLFTDVTNAVGTLSTYSSGGKPYIMLGIQSNAVNTVAGLDGYIRAEDADGGAADLIGGDLYLTSGKGRGAGAASKILFQTADVLGSGTTQQSVSTKMSILGSGNVGIGTTTPAVKLDVNGLIRVYQTSTTTCSASIEGSIFYNGTVGNKHFYGCDGTNWKQLD